MYIVDTDKNSIIQIPFTGCGINPARALAPAVIMSLWPNYHWVCILTSAFLFHKVSVRFVVSAS